MAVTYTLVDNCHEFFNIGIPHKCNWLEDVQEADKNYRQTNVRTRHADLGGYRASKKAEAGTRTHDPTITGNFTKPRTCDSAAALASIEPTRKMGGSGMEVMSTKIDCGTHPINLHLLTTRSIMTSDEHTELASQIEKLITIRYGRNHDEPVPILLLKAAFKCIVFDYPENAMKHLAIAGILDVVNNLRTAEEWSNGAETNSGGAVQHSKQNG